MIYIETNKWYKKWDINFVARLLKNNDEIDFDEENIQGDEVLNGSVKFNANINLVEFDDHNVLEDEVFSSFNNKTAIEDIKH